jgi:formylglycine-generating enzyme required for sulfatase activity
MPASTYKNSIGMGFVAIQAGTFLMGSPDANPEAQLFEKPQHSVTISRPFYIGNSK